MITFKCSEEVEMAHVSTTHFNIKVSIGCFKEVNFLQIFMFLIYKISFQDTESALSFKYNRLKCRDQLCSFVSTDK